MPVEISTASELQDIELDLTESYVVVNDIDASGTSTWNSGAGFVPLGGGWVGAVIDGGGHAISGLFIERDAVEQSLCTTGVGDSLHVHDLKLVDPSIQGSDNVGAMISRTQDAGVLFERCATEGGEIRTTAALGTGSGSGAFGGTHNGRFFDCYNRGTKVTAVNNGRRVGGFVGDLRGEVRRCYAACEVVGTGTATRTFNGRHASTAYSDNFADTELSGRLAGDGATGKTTAEMKDIDTFTDIATVGLDNPWDMVAGFDGTKVWGIGESLNNGYPWLQALEDAPAGIAALRRRRMAAMGRGP